MRSGACLNARAIHVCEDSLRSSASLSATFPRAFATAPDWEPARYTYRAKIDDKLRQPHPRCISWTYVRTFRGVLCFLEQGESTRCLPGWIHFLSGTFGCPDLGNAKRPAAQSQQELQLLWRVRLDSHVSVKHLDTSSLHVRKQSDCNCKQQRDSRAPLYRQRWRKVAKQKYHCADLCGSIVLAHVHIGSADGHRVSAERCDDRRRDPDLG